MADKAEGGRSGNGDGFCGINPVTLDGVIKDLAAVEAAITAEVPRFKAEFDKVGVPTGPVTDLAGVARWLHEQLPMLRRRQAAAALLASQGLSFTPNTSLLSIPEDSDAAIEQAADLAAQHTKARLDGKPDGHNGMISAVTAIERISNTKGLLSPDDVLFLHAYYGRLGKDVYKLPGYLRDDNNWAAPTRTSYSLGEVIRTSLDAKARDRLAAATVSGLLALSDERRGGNWNRLPDYVRKAAADKLTFSVMPDKGTVQGSGFDAQDLAKFLADPAVSDRAGLVFSKRLAITAAQSVNAYRLIRESSPSTSPIDDETSLTFLQVASRNEQAMRDLLTGKGMEQPAGVSTRVYDGYKHPEDFLVPITTNFWSDDGKAASETIGWIADAERSTNPVRHQLALEAWQGLIKTITDPAVLQAELDVVTRKIAGTIVPTGPELGVVNPMITRALARNAAGLLTALGGENEELSTARLFTLIGTDTESAEALAGAIYLHNLAGIHSSLKDPNRVLRDADPAGRLQGLLDAAFHNVAVERNEDVAQAQENADKIRGQVLGIASAIITRGWKDALDKELPDFPGLDPVDLLDRLLGRLLSKQNENVEPYAVVVAGVNPAGSTGGPTLVRYNFTKALLDSGQLTLNDLPKALWASGNPPQLLSPADVSDLQWPGLQDLYNKAVEQVSWRPAEVGGIRHHVHADRASRIEQSPCA